MTRRELTRSELLKDAAFVALGATVAICNKNNKIFSGTILTAAITIVAADISAVTRKKEEA